MGHGHDTKGHQAHQDHKENFWFLFVDVVGFVSFVPSRLGPIRDTLTIDNHPGIVGRHSMAPSSKPDLLQGTLDLLILKALVSEPLHGWAISKRIQQLSRDVLLVNQGSLYPALYRLEDRGWIVGAEAESRERRRIKVYRLTPAGRKQLAEQVSAWRLFSAAMNDVIGRA